MSLVIGGINRGARSIVNQLEDKTVRRYDPTWILADPKEGRAVELAKLVQHRFPTLQPQPLQMKVQDALTFSHEHDSVVLALDTPADTTQTLEARLPSQRVSFQLVGRGPGAVAGTRLAIQGTLCPEDDDTERRALLVLRTLSGMSQAASSRQLTGPDPLSAVVLTPLRQVVSRQTARHLGEKEREPQDLSGGALSVCFGQTLFPLYPVQGQPLDTHAQWKDRALDTVSALPANHFLSRGLRGGFAYVAVVIPEARAIHFMKVAQSRTGKRSIAGLTPFVSPRVQQQSQAALMTD